jgi:serine/threonine protein kinase
MKRNIYLSKRQLVIGDLGHARNYMNSKSVFSRGSMVGTSGYIAPEIITSTLNSNNTEMVLKIDIWLEYFCVYLKY